MDDYTCATLEWIREEDERDGKNPQSVQLKSVSAVYAQPFAGGGGLPPSAYARSDQMWVLSWHQEAVDETGPTECTVRFLAPNAAERDTWLHVVRMEAGAAIDKYENIEDSLRNVFESVFGTLPLTHEDIMHVLYVLIVMTFYYLQKIVITITTSSSP